jgi:dipeptidyl aminopeptidase/acylaminoacyl peptidase
MPMTIHPIRAVAGTCAALLGFALCATSASARNLAPEDALKFADVSEPQLSPDGRSIAYLVTTARAEDDALAPALWMVDWDGGSPLELTRSLKDVAAPRWSPDGNVLALLATPAGAEHVQLLLLDRRGGEARTLTRVTGDIDDYAWSPDGRRLVLAMYGAEAPPVGKVPRPIVLDALHFKDDVQGYLPADTLAHLYLVDAQTGAVEPLTVADAAHDSAPAWSADGQRIAFIRGRERGADADNMQDVMVVDARAGATARQVARLPAPNVQKLRWARDGNSLVLSVGEAAGLYAYRSDRLGVLALAGGDVRVPAGMPDRAVTPYALSGDGRYAEVLVEDDMHAYPARLPLGGGALERTWRGPEVVIAASQAAGHTVVLATGDASAPELYALEKGALRRLTHHNDALFADVTFGVVEELRFKSADGTDVHGVLVKPPGYVPGRRYPTVLWVHGGPQGEDEHSLSLGVYSPEFKRQLLAAAGYVALGINYRGSSGRGVAFQSAIAGHWCGKEVADLNAGVDAAIAAGIADPERLGVGGWSYGGILTDCLVVDSTRWKAGVSGAGSGNQLSMYGTDEYIHQYNAELPPPWRDLQAWVDVSAPFFHADRIRTPVLFVGGQKDFNVPIAGSEQMYAALRTLGVPSELVVYPDQFHIFTRPSYAVDFLNRMLGWYGRYLQPGTR